MNTAMPAVAPLLSYYHRTNSSPFSTSRLYGATEICNRLLGHETPGRGEAVATAEARVSAPALHLPRHQLHDLFALLAGEGNALHLGAARTRFKGISRAKSLPKFVTHHVGFGPAVVGKATHPSCSARARTEPSRTGPIILHAEGCATYLALLVDHGRNIARRIAAVVNRASPFARGRIMRYCAH